MSEKTDNIATELRQVAKGAGISGLGRIGLQLLQAALGFVLARAFEKEKLGLYFLGNNVVRLAEKVATLGLHRGGLRYGSIYLGRDDQARVKGVIVFVVLLGSATGLVILLVLLTAVGAISRDIFHNENLAPVLRVMVFAVPLFGLFHIVTQVCAARRTITPQVVSSVVYGVSILALFGLLRFGNLDIWALVWAYLLAAALSLLVGFRYLFRLFPVLFDRQVQPLFPVKDLLLFSLPLLLVDVATFGVSRLDIFLVGIWCSEAEVAIYGIAHIIAFFGDFGLGQVASVFRPIIADLHGRGELEKLGRIFKVATRWIVTLSLPICLFLITERRTLLGIFGEEFVAGQLALAILAGAHIVNASVGNVGWILIMSGRSWLSLANNAGAVALNIALGYMLIPSYGIVGAAVAAGAALALVNLIRLIEVRILMGLWPYELNIVKPCAAGVVAVALIHLVPLSGLVGLTVHLAVYILAYLSLLYGFGFDEADMLILRRIARIAGIQRPP